MSIASRLADQLEKENTALCAENAKLRQIITDMLAYAQDKDESLLRDSSKRIVIRMSSDTYHEARAALA